MSNTIEFLKKIIEELSEDGLGWQPDKVVEIEEIEINGKKYAKIEGDSNLYEKQDDGYIKQWTTCEDCYHGYILKQIEGKTYLKIAYDC